MRREHIWSTSATFHYSTVQSSRLTELNCHKCRATLDIIQPDIDRPDQFLATCPDCGSWYRVQTRAGEPRGVMVSLPDILSLAPVDEIIPNLSNLSGRDRLTS